MVPTATIIDYLDHHEGTFVAILTLALVSDGHGLNGPISVAVSADGKSVYAASALVNAVARLNRGTTTGGITQPAGTDGCVSETGGGSCADGHGLNNPSSVAVSPDGTSVYVASGGAVARFIRTP